MRYVIKLLLLKLLLLLASGVSFATVSGSPTNPDRLYHSVMKMDSASNSWKSLYARASLKVVDAKLVVTIWKYWAVENINPIFRVTVDNHPQWDDREDKWIYSGVIRRSADGPEKGCTLKSRAVLENAKNMEFTIVSDDFTGCYRVLRKMSR